MKKWNAPVVAELDVKNTENGFIPCCMEFSIGGFPIFGEVVTEEGNTGNGGDDDLGHLNSGTTATS